MNTFLKHFLPEMHGGFGYVCVCQCMCVGVGKKGLS